MFLAQQRRVHTNKESERAHKTALHSEDYRLLIDRGEDLSMAKGTSLSQLQVENLRHLLSSFVRTRPTRNKNVAHKGACEQEEEGGEGRTKSENPPVRSRSKNA